MPAVTLARYPKEGLSLTQPQPEVAGAGSWIPLCVCCKQIHTPHHQQDESGPEHSSVLSLQHMRSREADGNSPNLRVQSWLHCSVDEPPSLVCKGSQCLMLSVQLLLLHRWAPFQLNVLLAESSEFIIV